MNPLVVIVPCVVVVGVLIYRHIPQKPPELFTTPVLTIDELRKWAAANSDINKTDVYLAYCSKGRMVDDDAHISTQLSKALNNVNRYIFAKHDDCMVQVLSNPSSGKITHVRIITFGKVEDNLNTILEKSNFYSNGIAQLT